MALRGDDYEPDPLTTELRSPLRPRFSLSSLLVPLLLLLVVAAGGFVFYRFLAGKHRPAASASQPTDLLSVQQQLAQIEKRLERLEKQQRKQAAALASLPAKQMVAAKPANGGNGVPAAAHPGLSKTVILTKTVPTPNPAVDAKLASLENGMNANQQAWHATANQLADVVAQLGTAQGTIDQEQQALERLGTEHTLLRFDLQKGAKEKQVGPVRLYLKSADANRQRYTLMVLINDRWTELKNRALNEAVQFYLPKLAKPVEVVATQIGRDNLGGYLAVPVTKPSR